MSRRVNGRVTFHLPTPVNDPVAGKKRQANRDGVFKAAAHKTGNLDWRGINLHRTHATVLAYVGPTCDLDPNDSLSGAWRQFGKREIEFRFPLRYARRAALPF